MSLKKVVLAGGSGYIGSVLAEFYKSRADEVVVISRAMKATDGNIRTVLWDGVHTGTWTNELNGADLLINLAGKNVNCRYNPKNKDEILRSRLDSTEVLSSAISGLPVPPRVWIQCASATIYRHAEDRAMDEIKGEIGVGFSIEVCKAWESEFWEHPLPETRKILLRTSIVLGKSGGAFPRLATMVRAGLGGKQGSGKQYVSWIHEADVCSIIHWLYMHEDMKGTFNCTSPDPLPNKSFMDVVRRVANVPAGLPAPSWLLTFGAWLIGTETELILKSRWVMPANLLKSGYVFQFHSLKEAINDILKTK